MAKKKDEKDVLVVRDEKTGEISVVAGLNADSTPKRTPAKAGERAEFPAIRPTWRRAGQLLQELLPAVQWNPVALVSTALRQTVLKIS